MVIIGIAHFEVVVTSAFEYLLNITGKIWSHIFLDTSNHFKLSSLPYSNGVLKYLLRTPLSSHATLLLQYTRKSLPRVQQLLDTMVYYFGQHVFEISYKLILVDAVLTMVILSLALLPSKLHFLTEVGLINHASTSLRA